MHQENNGFSPIAIVLETKEDAEYEMALEISDWLSKLGGAAWVRGKIDEAQ